MKKIFISALVALCGFTASYAQQASFLSNNHCLYRISQESQNQKCLLLPVQENAEMANIKVIADNKQVKAFNVKLAKDHVDYFVPLYMDEFAGLKGLALDIHVNGDYSKEGLNALTCWENMKFSDTFDMKNREQYRSDFHHTPAYGWMNDPNGMFYKDGVWNLYFQYNPYGSQWENMTWGHSTSTDLVHWKFQGAPIQPDAIGTIFSGSAVVDKNNTAGLGKGAVVALYTSAPRSIDFKRNRLFVSGTQNPFQMVDKASEVRFADNIMNKNLEGLPSGIKIAKVKLPMVPTYQQMISRTIGKLSETAKTAKAEARTVMVAKDADLPQVLAQAEDGDSFVLQGDEYKLVKTVLVQKNVTIRSASGKTLLRSVGTSVPHLMTIDNGGSLEVEGLVFDGRLEPGGSSPETGISTAKTMTTPYKLKVNNCKFINFGENGCAAIRGQKSTFADSLIVTGCLIADCSGGGVDFASEKDDKGRYNAENMLIENCEFRRLLGTPVNVYRGGSDESTAGPYVTVRNCFFYDCCNKQRGSVLRLMGPQYLRVSDCQFFNSGRGGVSVRLDETSWEDVVIERCKFEKSGAVLAMRKEVYLNRQNQGL